MNSLKKLLIIMFIFVMFPCTIDAKIVVAKNSVGLSHEINVDDNETIDSVLNKIKVAFSLTNEKISATYNGISLDASKTLGEYQVEENSSINFNILRPYTITFNINGGYTGTMEDINNVYGEYTLPQNKYKPIEEKRFKGWSLTPDGEIIDTVNENSANESGVVVIYAIWEKVPKNYKYEFISGDKQVLEKGHIEDFTFAIEGDYELLDKVLINNKEYIKDVDYKVIKNKTVITFLEEGINKLNKLDINTYEIKVIYTNGKEVTGVFNIQKEKDNSFIELSNVTDSNDTPIKNTNENTSYGKLGCVVFLSSIMAFCIFIIKK